MPVRPKMFDNDDLPDLRQIIIPHHTQPKPETRSLRRSPRKNVSAGNEECHSRDFAGVTLSATSNQRQLSPSKTSPSKRSPSKTLAKANASHTLLDNVPTLPRRTVQTSAVASASNRQSPNRMQATSRSSKEDDLLASLSRLALQGEASDEEDTDARKRNTQTDQRRRNAQKPKEASRTFNESRGKAKDIKRTQLASRFVLDEARCEEDLLDSDAHSEGEDEDTDLSGFVVDDDAELSYHDSVEEQDSEEERQARKKAEKSRPKPRRRLQRGRKTKIDSEDEVEQEDELSKALGGMSLAGKDNEYRQNDNIEVIDLVSPDEKPSDRGRSQDVFNASKPTGTNLFDKFKALKLSPPRSSQILEIPSKSQSTMWLPSADEDSHHEPEERQNRYTTPPTTPPRSPTKLRSPSKLLSPSKRGDAAQRSPHRQSMDAFWDLNEVNEWNDQFSPKKAPVASPRKNRLAALGAWSDDEDEDDSSLEAMNESSDSLPSPCESPSKSKSRGVSPIKAEKQRLISEKKARQAEKKLFEATKEKMATDLLHALDKHVTDGRISSLSASTGGVQIIWSKTLRSTAGRANWRRTATRPTGSPVKAKSDESAPGVILQHYANIELAVKVIDRPDRLINTLAHEFCHLANFMVSGIRDQPHGTSFQNWARKVTKWMKSQSEVPQWNSVEVTTKHGYVIEWKYLWACVGREQNQAMKVLNIKEDEEGCGAEYGRHSKSIDVDSQRCGRCKGRLLQVRPKPRASPVKKAREVPARGKTAGKGINLLEKMIEVVELSD